MFYSEGPQVSFHQLVSHCRGEREGRRREGRERGEGERGGRERRKGGGRGGREGRRRKEEGGGEGRRGGEGEEGGKEGRGGKGEEGGKEGYCCVHDWGEAAPQSGKHVCDSTGGLRGDEVLFVYSQSPYSGVSVRIFPNAIVQSK